MTELRFLPVADEAGLDRLDAALGALATHLGDPYVAQRHRLRRALLGQSPSAHGLLALSGKQTAGAALFSPVYSTIRGGAGVHVSDLWVTPWARGQGVGRRLLRGIARRGVALWAADWLKLAVHDHSTDAQAFYRRLGFQAVAGMQDLRMDTDALVTLTAAPIASKTGDTG